jgi:hypothetical protein
MKFWICFINRERRIFFIQECQLPRKTGDVLATGEIGGPNEVEELPGTISSDAENTVPEIPGTNQPEPPHQREPINESMYHTSVSYFSFIVFKLW